MLSASEPDEDLCGMTRSSGRKTQLRRNAVIWLVLAFASVGLICGLASRSMELRAGAREVR